MRVDRTRESTQHQLASHAPTGAHTFAAQRADARGWLLPVGRELRSAAATARAERDLSVQRDGEQRDRTERVTSVGRSRRRSRLSSIVSSMMSLRLITDMATGGGGVPYIGSRISLISKSEIRYEGTLYTINTQESTVALQYVRSFGTEGRRLDGPWIAPGLC